MALLCSARLTAAQPRAQRHARRHGTIGRRRVPLSLRVPLAHAALGPPRRHCAARRAGRA